MRSCCYVVIIVIYVRPSTPLWLLLPWYFLIKPIGCEGFPNPAHGSEEFFGSYDEFQSILKLSDLKLVSLLFRYALTLIKLVDFMDSFRLKQEKKLKIVCLPERRRPPHEDLIFCGKFYHFLPAWYTIETHTNSSGYEFVDPQSMFDSDIRDYKPAWLWSDASTRVHDPLESVWYKSLNSGLTCAA